MSQPDWDIMTRYLARDASPAERTRVEAWIGADPANAQVLADLRDVASLADQVAAPERRAAVLDSLRREWGGVAPARGGRTVRVGMEAQRASRWLVAAKVAAAVVALVGGGWAVGQVAREPFRAQTPSAQPVPIAVSTARGERRALRLSDGTLVMLAPASTLRWSPTYGAQDRQVELEGEAVFTVTHDERRPFSVRTPNAVARDLGTRFSVRAYPGDTVTDVVVAEGVVAVAAGATPADSLVITGGDRARVRSDGRLDLARGVALDRYFAWTGGRLVFQDASLSDAVTQLARWYDIDLHVDPRAVTTRRLSASFEDEPASEAVRVVAAILDLQVSHTGHVYTLQAK